MLPGLFRFTEPLRCVSYSENRMSEQTDRRADVYALRVNGNSMRPFLRHGEHILVRRLPLSEIRVGDVAVFEHEGFAVAHRVVKVLSNDGDIALLAQGDAKPSPDAPVSSDRYRGRVITVFRGNRKIDMEARWRKPFQRGLAMLVRSGLMYRLGPLVDLAGRLRKSIFAR